MVSFGLLEAVAGQIQLQDDAVVHEAVYCRRGGHRIFEYLLPLGERQVAGDHHAASFVAVGHQGEEHLHFLTVLLDVTDVVDHQCIVASQSLKSSLEPELALGDKQLLDQQLTGAEEDPVFPARFPCRSTAHPPEKITTVRLGSGRKKKRGPRQRFLSLLCSNGFKLQHIERHITSDT